MRLNFDTHNFDTPLVSGVIENVAHASVDGFTRGESFIQLHVTNNVTEVGLGQLGDGDQGSFERGRPSGEGRLPRKKITASTETTTLSSVMTS